MRRFTKELPASSDADFDYGRWTSWHLGMADIGHNFCFVDSVIVLTAEAPKDSVQLRTHRFESVILSCTLSEYFVCVTGLKTRNVIGCTGCVVNFF